MMFRTLSVGARRASSVSRSRKRAQAIGVRIDDVAPFDQEQLGAAAADFRDDATGPAGQGRIGEQKRLDAEKRDADHLGFVERLDLKAGGDVDAIDERQAVGRFADGAGRDDANLLAGFSI